MFLCITFMTLLKLVIDNPVISELWLWGKQKLAPNLSIYPEDRIFYYQNAYHLSPECFTISGNIKYDQERVKGARIWGKIIKRYTSAFKSCWKQIKILFQKIAIFNSGIYATKEKPADEASRGIIFINFTKVSRWPQGPEFLLKLHSSWRQVQFQYQYNQKILNWKK